SAGIMVVLPVYYSSVILQVTLNQFKCLETFVDQCRASLACSPGLVNPFFKLLKQTPPRFILDQDCSADTSSWTGIRKRSGGTTPACSAPRGIGWRRWTRL